MAKIQLLLKHGADLNIENDLGRTPIRWLTVYPDHEEFDLAMQLLERGAQMTKSQIEYLFRKKGVEFFWKRHFLNNYSFPSDQLLVINACHDKGGHKLFLLNKINMEVVEHDFSGWGKNDNKEERLCQLQYQKLKQAQLQFASVYVKFPDDDDVGIDFVSADNVLGEEKLPPGNDNGADTTVHQNI